MPPDLLAPCNLCHQSRSCRTMLPQAPQLCAIANGSRAARICIGSDNPDNLYENAVIDGRREYVVHGVRGRKAQRDIGTWQLQQL